MFDVFYYFSFPATKVYVLCVFLVTVSDSLRRHRLQFTRLHCPWGFSRQEYQSGLPSPSPGDLPKAGLEPRSPALQADSLMSEPPGKFIVMFKHNSLSLVRMLRDKMSSTPFLKHEKQVRMPSQQKGTFYRQILSISCFFFFLVQSMLWEESLKQLLTFLKKFKCNVTSVLAFCEERKKS